MRDSFVFYRSYAQALSKMNTVEKALFIDALCAYALDGEEMCINDTVVSISLDLVKPQIDANSRRYENGKKGGRPKKETVVHAHKNHRFSEEKPNVNVNVNVNDNVNDNVNVSPNGDKENIKRKCDDLFEYLWSLYPSKKGKARVSDKTKRQLLEIGADEMERAIERYNTELAKDDWRKPQNGSTFFNSGYVDYLDANYVPSEEPQPKSTGNPFLDLLVEEQNDKAGNDDDHGETVSVLRSGEIQSEDDGTGMARSVTGLRLSDSEQCGDTVRKT